MRILWDTLEAIDSLKHRSERKVESLRKKRHIWEETEALMKDVRKPQKAISFDK